MATAILSFFLFIMEIECADEDKRNTINQAHPTHSLSTTFINTGIITVRFVTLAVTKVNKIKKINITKRKTCHQHRGNFAFENKNTIN